MTRERPAFLITIDTEGDDLWAHPHRITTDNSAWLPRFQETCEDFGFRPTYLVNYEMARCPRFRHFGRGVLRRGTAEIGMHLHAWNSPPLRPLTGDDYARAPYLIEYPADVMEEKIAFMTALLRDTFEAPITSHRAGRYGFDGVYARALEAHGYAVDCSVTPGVSWRSHAGGLAGGPDFTRAPHVPYFLDTGDVCRPGDSNLLEIPLTIVPSDASPLDLLRAKLRPGSFGARALNRLAPAAHWLFPNGHNRGRMLRLLDRALETGDTYVEFTLHSSELMPGGSPKFRTEEAIDALYRDLRALFAAAVHRFRPATLSGFANEYLESSPLGAGSCVA